jgi:hypothetical protein
MPKMLKAALGNRYSRLLLWEGGEVTSEQYQKPSSLVKKNALDM